MSPRRDRRTPAEDTFGKPDVSYPEGSLDHPKIVETESGRQTSRAPDAFLSTHPKFNTAKKTGHKTSPGENANANVTEVYETLPGASIVSYAGAAGGKLKRTTRQRVALPSLPTATGTNLIAQRVDALDVNVGIKTTEDWTNADGSTTGTPVPWITTRETVEPEGVEIITWVKTVSESTLPLPKGRSYLDTAGDLAAGGAYPGRRRIPTFPTGISNAGEWENAQAYVIHSERRAIEDSPNFTLIVQTCPIPRTRYTFPTVQFQFPALLTFNNSFSIEPGGRFPLNYDGNVASYTSHRTRSVVGCRVFRYTVTPESPALSKQFYLNAPGAASIYFGQIDNNTIYQETGTSAAGYVVVYNAAGSIIEKFPFSTLSGCAPASNSVAGTDDAIPDGTFPTFYRVKADQDNWRGEIYVREYLVLAEDRNIIADAQAQRFAPTNEGSATTTQYLFCA